MFLAITSLENVLIELSELVKKIMKKMPHFIVNVLPVFFILYLTCKVILWVFNYFTSCKFM
jgi:DNA integrity scanning protein DisA with diadenylate cyclase activity